jgi:tetratricopeptide (TPR) repeat protein
MRYADAAATKALQAGAYREAIHFIEQCIECARERRREPDPLTITRWRRQLADAHHGLGDLVRRRADAARALEAARRGSTPSPPAMGASVAVRLARELLAIARPGTAAPAAVRITQGVSHFELAKVYRHLVELAYFDNDGLAMLWGALHAVESAKQAGLLSDLARAYAQLGGTLGLVPKLPLAGLFLGKALQVAQRSSDPHAEAYAHMCNCLYMVGVARWHEARESTDECLRLGRRTGDSATSGNALMVRFWRHYYRGEDQEAAREASTLLDLAARAQNAQHDAWARRALGLLAARAGEAQRAVVLLEEARASLAGARNANEVLETDGILALARFQEGDVDGAEEAARGSLELARAVKIPTSHGTLAGIVGSLEVVAALRARRPHDPGWKALTRATLDTLRRYRRTFAVAEPAYFHWRGVARTHDGDPRGAASDWRHGLERALALEMHGDAARLRRALATGKHDGR